MLPPEILTHSFAGSEWSDPVNLGPAINTAANEVNPTLSPDALRLYFTSNCTGGLGAQDIWVSRRDCHTCPWQEAVNLGSPINSGAVDGGPAFSVDGLLLFFHSGRPGGPGGNDIYVSRRTNPNDDFAWGPPVLLGSDVNTPDIENAPEYLQSAEDGSANLYFNRGFIGTSSADLYYAAVAHDGQTRGPATLVAELSLPGANEASPTIRTDGREILFWSNRTGAPGGSAIMMSTRRSIPDAWSAPELLPPPANAASGAIHPSLSRDGRTAMAVRCCSSPTTGPADSAVRISGCQPARQAAGSPMEAAESSRRNSDADMVRWSFGMGITLLGAMAALTKLG